MPRYVVCQLGDLEVGKITPAQVGRSPIVLSKLPSGEIRAVSGRCPHQGANLQHGCISGSTESEELNHLKFCNFGETLRCPWHGFEFSLIDGLPAVSDSTQMPLRLRMYDVKVEGNDVVITT